MLVGLRAGGAPARAATLAAVSTSELGWAAAIHPNTSPDTLLALAGSEQEGTFSLLLHHPRADSRVLSAVLPRIKGWYGMPVAAEFRKAIVRELGGLSPVEAAEGKGTPHQAAYAISVLLGAVFPERNTYLGSLATPSAMRLLDFFDLDKVGASLVKAATASTGVIPHLEGARIGDDLGPLSRLSMGVANASKEVIMEGELPDLIALLVDRLATHCAWQVTDYKAKLRIRLNVLESDAPARRALTALGRLDAGLPEDLQDLTDAASLDTAPSRLSSLASNPLPGEYFQLTRLLAYTNPALPLSLQAGIYASLGEGKGYLDAWARLPWKPGSAAAVALYDSKEYTEGIARAYAGFQAGVDLSSPSGMDWLLGVFPSRVYEALTQEEIEVFGSLLSQHWDAFLEAIPRFAGNSAWAILEGGPWAACPVSASDLESVPIALASTPQTAPSIGALAVGHIPPKRCAEIPMLAYKQYSSVDAEELETWPEIASALERGMDHLASAVSTERELSILDGLVTLGVGSVAEAALLVGEITQGPSPRSFSPTKTTTTDEALITP